MLSPYRLLDLSDEQGIFCSFVLGELEADVVCVESPDDRDALLRLIESADVLVESRKPGEMDRLGLGFEELARLNPSLVYVSVTPFGQTGPKAEWAASDLTVFAASGALWLTGDEDRPPVRNSVPQSFPAVNGRAEYSSVAIMLGQLRATNVTRSPWLEPLTCCAGISIQTDLLGRQIWILARLRAVDQSSSRPRRSTRCSVATPCRSPCAIQVSSNRRVCTAVLLKWNFR
jgi:hypothetical protein